MAVQHVRRGAATALACLVLAAPGLAWAQATPQAVFGQAAPVPEPAGGAYTQRGISAEASAENAVVARERALANGQRAAFQRLANELQLPAQASDAQIDALVDSVVIEQERSTRTGYAARLTVNFNPGRVQDFAAGRAVQRPAAPGSRGPAVAFVEAIAPHGSLGEWLELRRRLAAHPQVARIEILAISTDRARLRLSLRAPAAAAAAELGASGFRIEASGAAAWRIGLGPAA